MSTINKYIYIYRNVKYAVAICCNDKSKNPILNPIAAVRSKQSLRNLTRIQPPPTGKKKQLGRSWKAIPGGIA